MPRIPDLMDLESDSENLSQRDIISRADASLAALQEATAPFDERLSKLSQSFVDYDSDEPTESCEPFSEFGSNFLYIHIRASLPDRTAEYADIPIAQSTIGDLKDAICAKRPTLRSNEVAVLFEGKVMQDDWLVSDIGIRHNGTVHIIPRERMILNLPLNTSSYPSFFTENDVMISEQSALSTKLLTNVPSENAAKFESSIRPEESGFHAIFSEFINRADDNTIFEKLLNDFQKVCQDRLNDVTSEPGIPSERAREYCQEISNERNTWRLLHDLQKSAAEQEQCEDDKNNSDGDDPYATDVSILEELEKKDSILRMQLLVKKWLEVTALERVQYKDGNQQMYSRTLNVLENSKRNGRSTEGIVEHLDPDATIRENARLERDDAEDEFELLRGVWGYIRAGELEKARDLCIKMGQPWRGASILGGTHCGVCDDEADEDGIITSDNGIVRWGNPFRDVWKSMCWKLAEKRKESDPAAEFERAIYAALSGNLSILLETSVCRTWDDHCWAYMTAAISRREDEIILKHKKRQLQRTKFLSGPRNLIHLEQQLSRTASIAGIDCREIFERLRTSPYDDVRKEADSIHHQIQCALVNSEYEDVVVSIIYQAIDGDRPIDWKLHLDEEYPCVERCSPSFLRFACHLVIFLRHSCQDAFESEDANLAGHMVVKAYIRHLVQHRQNDLVALYASQLPDEGLISVYSEFLQGIVDRAERRECLGIAKKLFPGVLPQITKLVVETIIQRPLSRKEEELAVAGLLDKLTPDDKFRLQAIEWLCFSDADRAEALLQSNLLMRFFVCHQKLHAARVLLLDKLPEDTLAVIETNVPNIPRAILEAGIREYEAWKAYLDAHYSYLQWREFMSLPIPEDENVYIQNLEYHTRNTANALKGVLEFENGWLKGVDFEHEQVHGMRLKDSPSNEDLYATKIRRLCIPNLLYHFHHVLYECGKKLQNLESARPNAALEMFQRSMQVAELAVNDNYKLYLALSPEETRHLLHFIHRSGLMILKLQNKITIYT